MIFKTLVFIGLLNSNVAAQHLRAEAREEDATNFWTNEAGVQHLDLEVIVEGKRELFPLLPGTRCPTGHHCRVRNTGHPGVSPMAAALRDSMKTTLTMSLDWSEFDKDLKTVVNSNSYCTRRSAMARAAGMAAGLSAATVMKPAYAAETKEVKMGADSGLLVFVPAKTTICKGDTITWINNKAGPHNVVFDEDNIPAGVDQEKISMIDEQLGDEGETFSRTFDTAGDYAYYCEPHRGAGMNGAVTVM